MDFHLKDMIEVEFTAYEGKMMKEVAQTSFTVTCITDLRLKHDN